MQQQNAPSRTIFNTPSKTVHNYNKDMTVNTEQMATRPPARSRNQTTAHCQTGKPPLLMTPPLSMRTYNNKEHLSKLSHNADSYKQFITGPLSQQQTPLLHRPPAAVFPANYSTAPYNRHAAITKPYLYTQKQQLPTPQAPTYLPVWIIALTDISVNLLAQETKFIQPIPYIFPHQWNLSGV